MGYALTDTGNAQRLVVRFAKEIRYVPAWGVFLVWDGAKWVTDTGGFRTASLARKAVEAITIEARTEEDPDRRKAINKWRAASEMRARIEAMIILSRQDLLVAHEDLDQNPHLLNCSNGIVDLATGKMRPSNPGFLFTKQAGTYYRPKAKAPRWERFLKRVIPDAKTREFLQRFAGYCATGHVRERTFALLYGLGKNGKSVFLMMLAAALGEYAKTAAPELLMAKRNEGHPTDVAALHGARLAIASEVKKDRTFDEEAVKRLTGGDTLTARRMREDFWSFRPTHKILLAANHRPAVKDASDSFWDRVALVPFNVRIAPGEVDVELPEKLRKELPGILAWIVRGSVAWHRRGLGRPPAVEAATRDYRSDEDRFGQFIAEQCALDPKAFARTRYLLVAYNPWAESNGFRRANANEIAEAMRERRCTPKHTKAGNGWIGVRLPEPVKDAARNDGRR